MTAPHTGADAWLRRYHPADADAVTLVCFPHAGGSAGYFHPFSAALAPSVAVVAVQYPGRQDRLGEPCVEDLGELAEAVQRQLRTLCGPLAFFGHSMGASIAFEVARRRELAGEEAPLMLFVSGRRAPDTRRAATEPVHSLDDAGLLARIKRLGGTHTQLLDDPELVDLVLPAVRGDYRAVESYHCPPGTVLRSPLTVLTGTEDPLTTAEEADAWRRHTSAACTVHTFPGGHFFLEPESRAVIATVSGALAGLTVR
ncbi:thioesterase II family protein [Streptomyces sp. NBC_00102]|uniref:thioesterase II family protein n=1 Tax=Streptomyces sp. NBC_00102 TaxID=2975652 RepID=UPI0022593752|nr:alpha/beta fold hydrolase [Streptomyces sp. NBC_00102]MCX5398712.1 alpha/beta fold hydrolase [Streptomyces sp. NBC_00102]